MTQYPALDHFFGCYLHQDWRADYADEWAALDDFLHTEQAELTAAFRQELAALLATNPSEEMLRRLLLEEIGAAAMVENLGWKYRDWMQALADHAAKSMGHPQAS